MKRQPDRRVLRLMRYFKYRVKNHRLQGQLFPQFPPQCLRRCFTRFDLPPGEFPPGGRLSGRPAANQYSAVAADDRGGHMDEFHVVPLLKKYRLCGNVIPETCFNKSGTAKKSDDPSENTLASGMRECIICRFSVTGAHNAAPERPVWFRVSMRRCVVRNAGKS